MSKKTNNQKEETVISAGKYNALVKQNEALKEELALKNQALDEYESLIGVHDKISELHMDLLLELKKSKDDLIATNKQSLNFIKMLLNNSDLNE